MTNLFDTIAGYVPWVIGAYLLAINLIAFITYGIDKRKAEKGKYRISEATLIILALIGGSIGALAGMKVFHHKTQKPKFIIGVPVILALQIAAVIYFGFTLIK